MRLALIVEYDGTGYRGFQYQVQGPTIQEELEKAITRLTNERTRVKAAGRTDAGVHAAGQTVAFDTDAAYSPETFLRALNHYLPDDIAVKAAYKTGGSFDPRRMARSRRYIYTVYCGPAPSPLNRRTAYHLGEKLNVPRMRRTAHFLVGTHDFGEFSGQMENVDASRVREIFEARVRQEGELVRFEVEGNAFLPHQVRRMAGALVDVGRGVLTPSDVKGLIDGDPGDTVARSLPPHGLCLMEVAYDDFPPKVGE